MARSGVSDPAELTVGDLCAHGLCSEAVEEPGTLVGYVDRMTIMANRPVFVAAR